jgi:serine/threonine-protein kinase
MSQGRNQNGDRRASGDDAAGTWPREELTDEALAEPIELAGQDGVERYLTGDLLGRGGMGEVRICRDRRIGRDIAMKLLKRPTAATQRGFLREARMQGRLEHPAVVPVHDLGVTPDGKPFFTMKLVRGRTLGEVIDRLAAGDAEVAARYSRRKLLAAFSTVCLAVDFAHSHGVLHRDIKPGNIMLGDFGEVHLLDWGLARVMRAGESLVTPLMPADGSSGQGIAPPGTPGYMSPEQARGEAVALGPRSDVYALGAVLFEILALAPLHRGGEMQAYASTLRGGHERASSLRTGVPPALDDICFRATSPRPEDRFASARELAEDVERWLDGELDVERRRRLAEERVAHASRLLAQDGEGLAGRLQAMRELLQALTLDPDHRGALSGVVRLIGDLPREIPPEVEATLRARERGRLLSASRVGAGGYLLAFAFLPLTLWIGVRHWLIWIAFALMVAAAGAALWLWRSGRGSVAQQLVVLALGVTAFSLVGGWFGPFVIVPTLLTVQAVWFQLHTGRAVRRITMAVSILALTLPVVLELGGWVAPAHAFVDGAMLLLPRLLAMPRGPTLAVLTAGSVAMVAFTPLALGLLRDALRESERTLILQRWYLDQLVPEAARRSLADASGATGAAQA